METNIILGGKAYSLRPDFDHLSKIEKELAASITELSVKLLEGAMTLHELAFIITICLEPQMPGSFVKEALFANGFAQATQGVATMFSMIFSGMGKASDSITAMSRDELAQMSSQFPDQL